MSSCDGAAGPRSSDRRRCRVRSITGTAPRIHPTRSPAHSTLLNEPTDTTVARRHSRARSVAGRPANTSSASVESSTTIASRWSRIAARARKRAGGRDDAGRVLGRGLHVHDPGPVVEGGGERLGRDARPIGAQRREPSAEALEDVEEPGVAGGERGDRLARSGERGDRQRDGLVGPGRDVHLLDVGVHAERGVHVGDRRPQRRQPERLESGAGAGRQQVGDVDRHRRQVRHVGGVADSEVDPARPFEEVHRHAVGRLVGAEVVVGGDERAASLA